MAGQTSGSTADPGAGVIHLRTEHPKRRAVDEAARGEARPSRTMRGIDDRSRALRAGNAKRPIRRDRERGPGFAHLKGSTSCYRLG